MAGKRGSRSDTSHIKNFPKDGVIQRDGKHIYVIKRIYRWDEEKKKYREKRIILGQVVDNVFYTQQEYKAKFKRGMIPRDLHKPSQLGGEFSPEMQEILSAGQKRHLGYRDTSGIAGSIPILYRLAVKSGLASDLTLAYSREIALQIISIAFYFLVSRDNSVTRYAKFAISHRLPWPVPFSTQQISELYADLGANPNRVDALFMARLHRMRPGDGTLCVSVDSTTVASGASRYSLARNGKNKHGEYEPQINLMLTFNNRAKEPLCYRVLPGNAHDSRSVEDALEELEAICPGEITRVTFDRGYLSLKNLYSMKTRPRNEGCFALKIHAKWSYQAVDEALETIDDAPVIPGSEGARGVTVKKELKFEGHKFDVWVHVYKFAFARGAQEKEFMGSIDQFIREWKELPGDKAAARKSPLMKFVTEQADGSLAYNNEVIAKHSKYLGVFGTVTTFECTAEECWFLYDVRADIERVFRSGKQDVDLNTLRTHENLTCAGKMLVLFCAMCLLESLKRELAKTRYRELKKAKHVEIPGCKYDARDVTELCESVRYVRDIKTGLIKFRIGDEDQNLIAKAAGCEGVYDLPCEY